MNLNKKTILALDLVRILKGGQVRTVKGLATELKTSVDYLQQIVVKLRRKGLITSVRGPGGGIRRDLYVVKAFQVIDAMGDIRLAKGNVKASESVRGMINDCLERIWV